MTPNKTNMYHKQHRGFSLIEVLVALLVLSFGLLGLAALQVTSLRYNTGSYYRTQATYLAYDILDRMRTNSAEIKDSNGSGYDQPVSTNVTSSVNCDTTPCASTDLAAYDVKRWYDRAVATLPDAAATSPTIQIDPTRVVTITIQWREHDLLMKQEWIVQL